MMHHIDDVYEIVDDDGTIESPSQCDIMDGKVVR